MKVEFYLISDGTINSNITDALIVEATEPADECIVKAIEAFMMMTHTLREEVVVNPVGPRCG